MKAKEIRDLSTEEIASQIAEEKEQLSTLQFQHAIADLQNPMILRDKRRFIAPPGDDPQGASTGRRNRLNNPLKVVGEETVYGSPSPT